MGSFDTAVNLVIASTTEAGWHVLTTGFAAAWQNLIYFGAVFVVAGIILGAIHIRRRRRGRR